MKVLLNSLLAATTLLAACHSAPWRRTTVDEVHLYKVSEGTRNDLADQQAEISRRRSLVAETENTIELERQFKRVAEQEIAVAEENMELVEARKEVAAADSDGENEYDKELQAARARVAWAQAQRDYMNARIREAEAERELAERQLEAEQARLELQKAKAVSEIDDDEIPDYDISRFQRAVDQADVEISMAEIELDAAGRRAEVHKNCMKKLADRVDGSHRESWHYVEDRREAALKEASARRKSREKNDDRDADDEDDS